MMFNKNCLLFLVVLFLFSKGINTELLAQNQTSIDTTITTVQYQNYASELFQKFRYDECLIVCQKILKAEPTNINALNITSVVYLQQKKWKEGIEFANKLLAINPNVEQVYDNLYFAYSSLDDWNNAKITCENALKVNPANTSMQAKLLEAKSKIKSSSVSIKVVYVIGLLLLLLLFYYTKKTQGTYFAFQKNTFGAVQSLFAVASINYLCYILFFHFADKIHSYNIQLPASEYTPAVRNFIFEHDGIEGYVLYAMITLNIVISIALINILSLFQNQKIYLATLFIGAAFSFLYFDAIQFIPPMNEPSKGLSDFLPLLISISIISLVLYFANKFKPILLVWIIALLLIPICFIATGPISFIDYTYIFAPALRMMNGIKLSEIYFQYDLFLSLLSIVWMKMNLDITHFQVLGRLAHYALILGLFIFTRKYFKNKLLPIFLAITLVLIRYYGLMSDVAESFQVTPFRLDLWFVLILLVYWKNAHHWLVALAVGILIFIHRNFGLLYLSSYLQLLLALFIINLIDNKNQLSLLENIKNVTKKHLLLNYKNILILIAFLTLTAIVFKGFVAESAILYQKVGIGMIQVSEYSFYWNVAIMLCLLGATLYVQRNYLSEKYFNVGIFILLLSVSNSMYFFGRSHEHNILNISAILILAFFVLVDVLELSISQVSVKLENKKNKNLLPPSNSIKVYAIKSLPLFLIFFSTYFYGNRISDKIKKQKQNYKAGNYYSPAYTIKPNVETIKIITKNSSNVYFLDYDNDFILYYTSHYQPLGYFSPCTSWILNKDLANFVQSLLDKNHYIVTTDCNKIQDILPMLNYNRLVELNGYTSISKEETSKMLTTDKNEILHLSLVDSIPSRGIDLAPINLNTESTIELLIEPSLSQVANATVFENMQQTIGNKGIVMQQAGGNANQFIFAFGNKKEWISCAPFELLPTKLNYVSICLSKNILNVFVNGKMISSLPLTSTLSNSELTFIVGNARSRDKGFKGKINELKITKESKNEAAIANQWQSLYKN